MLRRLTRYRRLQMLSKRRRHGFDPAFLVIWGSCMIQVATAAELESFEEQTLLVQATSFPVTNKLCRRTGPKVKLTGPKVKLMYLKQTKSGRFCSILHAAFRLLGNTQNNYS